MWQRTATQPAGVANANGDVFPFPIQTSVRITRGETIVDNLYQFCVILDPTEKARRDDARSELVVPPSDWIMARNEQAVVMKATQAIPKEHMENADRLRVIVRPF